MLPTPKHLLACTEPRPDRAEEDQYASHLTCPCGSETFDFQHTGGTHEYDGQTIPCVTEIDGEFYLRVVAKCTDCESEHLLLDKDFHGWNGYVCREESKANRPRPPLTTWQCRSCDATGFTGNVLIYGEDLGTAISESSGALNESNWQNAFGWIGIDLHCIVCGDNHDSWISYETM